uniref:Uncharacterized protein n=1 Tax=Anguilla anguilla TaxID=7936 RepID=A0A0E9RRM6_ANGAN
MVVLKGYPLYLRQICCIRWLRWATAMNWVRTEACKHVRPKSFND